jgi:hypothetical protein
VSEAGNPARYALFKALFLPSEGMSRASVDGLIDAFAHELAEEIREERDAMEAIDPPATRQEIDALSYAASVIDPYDDEGVGVVRPDEETG